MLLLEKLHLSHSYNLFCKTQKYEIISYYIGIGHDKQIIIVYWHIIILLFFGHRNLNLVVKHLHTIGGRSRSSDWANTDKTICHGETVGKYVLLCF